MIAGLFFVWIVGTLSHFIYEWTGNNPIIGLFTPVNESTWEHMKLLFFPMLIISMIIHRRLQKAYPCITSALAAGILLGTFLIPVIFYTYTGILGYNLLVLDILTFFISVAVAFYTAYKLTLSCSVSTYTSALVTLLILMMVCFFLFTYFPPNLGLFAIPGA